MFIERNIEATVRNVSETFPVLMLTGPRQIGKTTLLERLVEPDRKCVSLDSPSVRLLAQTDPELFLQRYAPPVMIDEVQYAPQLFPYIKILADQRKKPGDFWLTGSQMFSMMQNVTESLAGRVGIVPMQSLSSAELDGRSPGAFTMDITSLKERVAGAKPKTISKIFERIFKGSMPRLHENEQVNRELFYESYLDTYLSRDIRHLDQIANETSYMKFIQIAAARTATNVNYETMAQEAGISAPTTKKWLSILVSSGIVALIQPYANNALKRIIKAPRMYFLDTGLCAHLMGWGSALVLENSAMSGAFFETWVISEIYKSYLNAGRRPPMYFYRDSNKKEIDLILYENGTVHPIEIKKNSVPANAVKNFSVLAPIEQEPENQRTGGGHLKTAIGTGGVICMTPDLLPLDRNNLYIPSWCI